MKWNMKSLIMQFAFAVMKKIGSEYKKLVDKWDEVETNWFNQLIMSFAL